MVRKKMQVPLKSCALALSQKKDSGTVVARNIEGFKKAIYQLRRSAELLPPGMEPWRKLGSGAPKIVSPITDKL